MKKIWIDGSEANVRQRLGSGMVAYELIKNIEKLDKKNRITVLLPGEPLEDLPKEREGFKYKNIRIKRLKNILGIPFEHFFEKEKPDVYFSPSHYTPRFIKTKVVATIFDLSYLHFPQMFTKQDLYKLTKWTEYTIKNSDHLITISNFSKKDLIKNYKVKKNTVSVAYPGYDEQIYKVIKNSEKIAGLKNKYGIENYIIYIGTIQPRKNIAKLIEAFTKIDDLKLVIVGKTEGEGKSGWMYEEILDLPKKLGIEDKVIFTGYVEKEELVYLLNGAGGFVLPSLWEGFGIPVVEAMACGVPVIVSNISSLPEIVGDAGLLVDPNSVDQIEQAIRLLTTDKKIYDKFSRKGLEKVKRYSWKKMTKEVLKVLENV